MHGEEVVKTHFLFLSFPTVFSLKTLEVKRGRDGVSLVLCQLLSRCGCHDKKKYPSAIQALLSVENDGALNIYFCNPLAPVMKLKTFSVSLAAAFAEFVSCLLP